MDKELSREIILEHFQNPLNKEATNDKEYKLVNSKNPNCIDNLDIKILIKDDMIKDIKFTGEACAISTASTSIMIKNLIGMQINDVKKYIDNFYRMCDGEDYEKDLLKEGLAFQDIYKQNNRKNCALLPYKGILKAIEDYENK